eukprot:TRINITY_DN29411_c0_g1_i4.p1 TRINITY_DN29411_c0_g1~~TRINITY_DN29411_c0_g1_i4.p1  ORF type:complete len:581 (-),score=163.58 TRINITY_DN29411_c0_g1_i4:70-1812(-)
MYKHRGFEEAFHADSWEAFAKGSAAKTAGVAASAAAKVTRHASGLEFADMYAEDIANGYVWLDFASVPHVTPHMTADECAEVQGQRALAIRSTPKYISRSTYFYMCATRAMNDSGEIIDFSSWRQGGWCRAEELANFLSPSGVMSPVVLTEAPKATVLEFFDFFLFRGSNPMQNVFSGTFSCCQRGHVRKIHQGRHWHTPCDKHLLAEMLDPMIQEKLDTLKAAGNNFLYRLYRCMEPALLADSCCDRTDAACDPHETIEEFLARFLLPDDPKQPDESGAPAIEWAAFQGHAVMVEKLIDAKCDASVVDHGGLTPLLGAVGCCFPIETTKVLLEKGGLSCQAINEASKNFGVTPLDRAAKTGNLEVAKLLVEAKANLDVKRKDGRSPVHTAAESGHREVCEFLLEMGADVNALTDAGETPLHCAAYNFCPFGLSSTERVKVVQLLLKRGVNAELKDMSGRTALQIAADEDYVDFQNALAKATSASPPLDSDGASEAAEVDENAANTQADAADLSPLEGRLLEALQSFETEDASGSAPGRLRPEDEALRQAVLSAVEAHRAKLACSVASVDEQVGASYSAR